MFKPLTEHRLITETTIKKVGQLVQLYASSPQVSVRAALLKEIELAQKSGGTVPRALLDELKSYAHDYEDIVLLQHLNQCPSGTETNSSVLYSPTPLPVPLSVSTQPAIDLIALSTNLPAEDVELPVSHKCLKGEQLSSSTGNFSKPVSKDTLFSNRRVGGLIVTLGVSLGGLVAMTWLSAFQALIILSFSVGVVWGALQAHAQGWFKVLPSKAELLATGLMAMVARLSLTAALGAMSAVAALGAAAFLASLQMLTRLWRAYAYKHTVLEATKPLEQQAMRSGADSLNWGSYLGSYFSYAAWKHPQYYALGMVKQMLINQNALHQEGSQGSSFKI